MDTTPTGPESASDVPPEVKTEAENKKSPYTMVVRALKYVLTYLLWDRGNCLDPVRLRSRIFI